MRESQYLESYLRENRRRGDGNGLTVGTFIAYQLRGEAKSWAGRYKQSLENSLLRNNARRGVSKMGRIAYY